MIKVSLLQRGNKLLEYLGVSSWHYDGSCSADYEVNFSTFVLFLSLKFHSAKPEYIHKRIAKLKEAKLRVLLVLIDTPNYGTIMRELFRTIPIIVVPCRTYEECSRYIKGFDICTKRGSEVLRKKDTGVNTFLNSIPKINKTDSSTLQNTFNSLSDIIKAEEKDLENIVGIGKVKAKEIFESFRKPFKNG